MLTAACHDCHKDVEACLMMNYIVTTRQMSFIDVLNSESRSRLDMTYGGFISLS